MYQPAWQPVNAENPGMPTVGSDILTRPRSCKGVGRPDEKRRAALRPAGGGSAAILAAVAGILPETSWEHGLVCESGVCPRRGFGKMPNPAAKMAALPPRKTAASPVPASGKPRNDDLPRHRPTPEIQANRVIRFPCGSGCLNPIRSRKQSRFSQSDSAISLLNQPAAFVKRSARGSRRRTNTSPPAIKATGDVTSGTHVYVL